MADLLDGNLGTGLLFGLGAVVLAPLATRVIRPVVKATVKGGMTLYRDSGIGDAADDLFAEVRSELGEGRRRTGEAQKQSAAKAS